MDNDEFENALLWFIQERFMGKDVSELAPELLGLLSRTQTELLMAHDFMVREFPDDLKNSMLGDSEESLKIVKTFLQAWMARAELQRRLSEKLTKSQQPLFSTN